MFLTDYTHKEYSTLIFQYLIRMADLRYERRNRRNNDIPGGDDQPNHDQGNLNAPIRRIEDRFRKEGPPTFNGLGEPTDAEKWVRSLDRIFDFIGGTPQERVNCAVYQLVEEADYWWESEQRALTPEARAALTWDAFKTTFFEKYVPKSYRHQKESEFWNLRQGAKTVTEYDRIFNQLSRYAPTLVDTDEKRAERFRQGLRPVIGMPLASHGKLTYAEALSRALGIEAAMPKESNKPSGGQGTNNKRRWEDRNSNQGKKPWQGQAQQGRTEPRGEASAPKPVPTCPNCKKQHRGTCRLGTNACFACGQMGHYLANCPKNNRAAPNHPNQGNPPRPQRNQGGNPRYEHERGNPRNNQGNNTGQGQPHQGRAYALNQQEAARAPENLAGMIEINGIPVIALFDTGASHTFISNAACKNLDLVLEKSSQALVVLTPSGEEMIAEYRCPNLGFKIGSGSYQADPHVIPMVDFDLILGMD